MDLDNHRKHSFSKWMQTMLSEIALAMARSLQCLSRTNGTKKNFKKWKMQKILLQILLWRQQKWLQCIIQMCSWLPMVGDHWTSVADCQCLNSWGRLRRLFGESLQMSFESGQNLLVSRFWNLFLKPWDKENQNEIMRAWLGPWPGEEYDHWYKMAVLVELLIKWLWVEDFPLKRHNVTAVKL